MILIPFNEIFSEIAEKETRSFHFLQDNEDTESPPAGTYNLIELWMSLNKRHQSSIGFRTSILTQFRCISPRLPIAAYPAIVASTVSNFCNH